MNLSDQKFTIRQVAEIHGEKIPTLQSWADKGWARITPAPGPGQARELTVVDVYYLSIAIAFERIGVAPQTANQIAFAAIFHGHTYKRASERTWSELGETQEQYFSGSPERQTRPGPEVRITIADLDPAFRWRETVDPYHLFARAGALNCNPNGAVVLEALEPTVNMIRIRARAKEDPDGLAVELAAGALSDIGHYINLTELLFYVDDALRRPVDGQR